MGSEKIDKIAVFYYSRTDVQEGILKFCQDRETIPRYHEEFGKRPDNLQYPQDIIQQVKKGATSFHCSEELWQDPLAISTEIQREQLDKLRKGWDLLIDIDSKYLDYSKLLAELIIKALKFHGVKNFGIKFSGNKGFHIIVPWHAFPEQINEVKTKDMFPEWPRMIVSYLHEIVKEKFVEKISRENKSYVKDFEAVEKVMPDLILISPRHLFRCPYSLHEKTSFASIVISEQELENFQPKDADPLKIKIKNFYPETNPEEARELLIQALDWYKSKSREQKEGTSQGSERKFEEIKIDKSSVILPPSITRILEGMKDGKKRALFILINFFRCLNFTREEIEKKIEEWNKKNEKPLKIGYIKSQLDWAFRNKKILPPNYDKPYYKDIGILPDDEEIRAKNPVSYAVKKSRKLRT